MISNDFILEAKLARNIQPETSMNYNYENHAGNSASVTSLNRRHAARLRHICGNKSELTHEPVSSLINKTIKRDELEHLNIFVLNVNKAEEGNESQIIPELTDESKRGKKQPENSPPGRIEPRCQPADHYR